MKKQKRINYLEGREKYLLDKINKIREKDFEIVLDILNKYGIVEDYTEIKSEQNNPNGDKLLIEQFFKLTRYE